MSELYGDFYSTAVKGADYDVEETLLGFSYFVFLVQKELYIFTCKIIKILLVVIVSIPHSDLWALIAAS